MEAIDHRLRQFQRMEKNLYVSRKPLVHRRLREDEEVQAERQTEDQDYQNRVAERDDEKDVGTLN